jgi:hypothetical protein
MGTWHVSLHLHSAVMLPPAAIVVPWNPATFLRFMLLILPAALRRITFYLAQTLMAIAQHEEAYGWYEKRVALGGWHVSDLGSYLHPTASAPCVN